MSPRSTSPAVPAEVVDALVQTAFAVVAVVSQVAAEHDLSLTQLRVLAILRDRQPKISELAQHLGLDKSSVSGLVDRGVQRGLVQRDVSRQDARAVHVSLTRAGQRLAATGAAQIAEGLAPIVERLKPAEQQRLSALLAVIID